MLRQALLRKDMQNLGATGKGCFFQYEATWQKLLKKGRVDLNRKIKNKVKVSFIFLSMLVFLWGCGSGKETSETSEEAQSEETAVMAKASDELSGEDMGMASEAQGGAVSETYPETTAAEGVNEEFSPYFGIMHAVLSSVVQEEGGVTVYTFQDKLDRENSWSIPGTELGDVLVDTTPGTETAILFHGDVVNDSENVDFIVMLPEGEYEIKRAEGISISNAMSTFTIRTDQSEEISFIKDNCVIQEGSLEGDNGDNIVVYYARSIEDGVCYPFKVYAAS